MGGGLEYTHIIHNIVLNLDHPIFVQGALDIARPDDCAREVRYLGTAWANGALTFVQSIRFLHMLGRSWDLGAVPRDYTE